MTPAWRVAAALALACDLDWGRWARSRRPNPNCDLCWGRGGERDGDVPDQWYPCECLRPVADPSDVAAYLADCARRGVEPGPLPSLEYWDAQFGWSVFEADGEVRVRFDEQRYGTAAWFSRTDTVLFDSRSIQRGVAKLIVTFVTAAAAALETSDG